MENRHLEALLEEIDAVVFTGDALEDSETLREFKQYLGRWNRATAEPCKHQWCKLDDCLQCSKCGCYKDDDSSKLIVPKAVAELLMSGKVPDDVQIVGEE